MRRRASQINPAIALTQVRMLLAGCTDVALQAMTVERLVSSYQVDRKTAEYELTIARKRRAA